MNYVEELKQKKNALREQRKAIHEAATREDRELTADEQKTWDELGAKVEAIQSLIDDEPLPQVTGPGAGSPLGFDRTNTQTISSGVRTMTLPTGNDALSTWCAQHPKEAADTGGFGSLGEFLCAVGRSARRDAKPDERLEALSVANRRNFTEAISSAAGWTGGYLLPVGFTTAMLRDTMVTAEYPLLRNATFVPMTTDKMSIPVFADSSHANSPLGIEWQTVAENEAFTQRDVKVESRSLVCHKRGAKFYLSNELVMDGGPTTLSIIGEALRSSLLWDMEDQLWNSTAGITGALNCGSALEIAAETGQAAATIVTENLAKMYARMLPFRYNSAIWVSNQKCIPQLASLNVTLGATSEGVGFVSGPRGAMLEPPNNLFGRPLFYSECLSTLGTSGDIVFIDPKLYAVGVRLDPVVESSIHERFGNDQVTYRVKYRAGGVPLLRETFTPANGDTCAWLVKIATRA